MSLLEWPADHQTPAKPFQFGLRTLMLAVTLGGIWLGILRAAPGVAIFLLTGLAPPFLTWINQWGREGIENLNAKGRVAMGCFAIVILGPALGLAGTFIGFMLSLFFPVERDYTRELRDIYGTLNFSVIRLTAFGFAVGGCSAVIVALCRNWDRLPRRKR